MKTRGIDMQKWTFACTVYATRWVGLGLWDRCLSYVSYAKTAYYMHTKHVRIIYTPKSIFVYQYHEFSFLFGVLFIRIFMRLGSYSVVVAITSVLLVRCFFIVNFFN